MKQICNLIIIGISVGAYSTQVSASVDQRDQWAIAPGYSLEIVADDFLQPVMIAMVPHPGPKPEDPYCFVTELNGTVRVVSNNGESHVFAKDFFKIETTKNLPEPAGAMGLTGIALDPKTGFVFVTFAYQDENKKQYNNVARFETQPQIFSIKPKNMVTFTDLFTQGDSDFQQIPNGHQIGECIVVDDKLFIGVGDGENHTRSRSLNSLFGKVLCLTLDGKPHPGNPFSEQEGPASMVYTMGLRNPFGLTYVAGRIFAADNGPGIDRIIEAVKGGDGLYDGRDASIGLNAIATLYPARGMGQMTYLDGASELTNGGFGQGFLLARTGPPEKLVDGKHPAVTWLGYNSKRNRITTVERTLIEYIGNQKQCLNALATNGNEILFAPLFVDGNPGPVPLYRIQYKPTQSHSQELGISKTGPDVIFNRGCIGCHMFQGMGNALATSLEPAILIPNLTKRLNSPQYEKQIAAMAEADGFASQRKTVIEALGNQRIKRWLTEHIIQPSFDSPQAVMPALGIPRSEARILADYLVDEYAPATVFGLENRTILKGALVFSAGVFATIIGMAFFKKSRKRFKRQLD